MFLVVSYEHFIPARSVSLEEDGLVSHQKSREEVTPLTHSHQGMCCLFRYLISEGEENVIDTIQRSYCQIHVYLDVFQELAERGGYRD